MDIKIKYLRAKKYEEAIDFETHTCPFAFSESHY